MNQNVYTSQNVLISTSNKDSDLNLNNDLYIRFPNKLFIKDIAFISLLDFNIDNEISLFGNSNSELYIEYKNTNNLIINQSVTFDFNSANIQNDNDLATFLTDTLNAQTLDNYTCTFNVSQVYIISIITNPNPEVDLSTTTYTITTTNPISFYFNTKSSIGPLIGFGTGIYLNTTSITGNTVQSISVYNTVTSINDSAASGTNPNYDDLNCKMLLYDQNGNVIQNANNTYDATISLNPLSQKNYHVIGDLLYDLETAMNEYSTSFTPEASFTVVYDYTNNNVVIGNSTGAKFGIGFDFYNEIGLMTSGSLHRILGLRQKTYKHINYITSEYPSRSFMNIFSDDYILVCSDIINNNDNCVIGLSNHDKINGSNILFAIKYSSDTINFSPNNPSDYKISLKGSSMSLNYKNRAYSDTNPNLVNFYLRLLSGRHISSTISWSMMLKLTY